MRAMLTVRRGAAQVAGSLALVLALSCPLVSQGQFMEPGSLPDIDEEVQAAMIDSIITVLDSSYVMVDEGARMIRHLREGWANGQWRDLRDPVEFARRINQEMHSVYDDGHLGLAIFPPIDPDQEEEDDPRDHERRLERMRKGNYGFEKIEIMPGNIGYLKLNQFANTDYGGETAVAAMNFVANSDALIIDLRQNGGGSASMIQLLAGYLLAEQEHLINWYQRAEERTVQSYSQAYVPGRRMPETPLYILTSGSTFSAAEEFTFDMKNLERATVVGDTTGGGGNTVASYAFDFEDFILGMRASFGAATDPRTGEGWEGVGIPPHIPVESAKALDKAYQMILGDLLEEAGPEERFDLEWAMQDLTSRLEPVTLESDEMNEYVGTYGPRRIFMDGDQLFYQRDDRPRHRLLPMAKDLFRVGDLTFFRLEFERNDGGDITGLIGLYDNGRREPHARE